MIFNNIYFSFMILIKYCSRLRSVECTEKFHYFCSTPVFYKPKCPADHFYHKGMMHRINIKCKFHVFTML